MKVNLREFVSELEIGETYYCRSGASETFDCVEIFRNPDFKSHSYVTELPYTRREWEEFLQRSGCDTERGDYNKGLFARCRNDRRFIEAEEDGVKFRISAGKDMENDSFIDIFSIISINGKS